jgi:uncharacterized circularly permuted ATP-grasp superfamily protein/uncharacterized alpha-E superfamily protein
VNPEWDNQAPVFGLTPNNAIPPGHYNEAFSAQGIPRSHWEYLLHSFESLGEQGLQDRVRKASRILRDDGATYNLSDRLPGVRPWEIDPVPMVFSSAEWADIERGLIQRSEVLNAVLNDIYGKRELIHNGIIPPEAIYGHPGFLRQCDAQPCHGPHQLIIHGLDMVRADDGSFCIIGDRVQAPSGIGYALENRTVLSRVLPSIFRDSQVHRLALFFQTLRETLTSLAQMLNPYPNIVILTPGSYSETYFEHAFLSNYLGFPLVQGSDLRVKNGKLWLKSLNGLIQVDLVIRRVDDYFCDPVELRPDSILGIAGLQEVIRAGNVIVTNPLGSGIAESPVLLKYLPKISEYFFGRPLLIDSVKTWWGGDRDDLSYIRENLGKLIIKPVSRTPDNPSIYSHRLNKTELKQLWDDISRSPLNYVAQDYISPSYLPSWQKQLFQRPAIFRSFTVSNQSSYAVMAGGLTRVGVADNDTVVSNRTGSISKDTWIIASEAEKQVSLLDNRPEFFASASETELPGRVVENLFWMGRYAERTENTLRFTRTLFMQLHGVDTIAPSCRDRLFEALPTTTTSEDDIPPLLLDELNPNSVKSNIYAFLSCSEEVKELLSADTNRIINDLQDQLYDLERAFVSGTPSAPEESLDPLVTSLLALSGLSHESMLRGAGWRFQEMGRRSERVLQAARLIQKLLGQALNPIAQQQAVESALLSMEAMISFKRRYRGQRGVINALELLLTETANPRAIIYQLNKLQRCFEQIPNRGPQSAELTQGKKLLLQAIHQIQLADLPQLVQADPDTGSRFALNTLLTDLTSQIEQFSDLLSDEYFDHQAELQQLTGKKRMV